MIFKKKKGHATPMMLSYEVRAIEKLLLKHKKVNFVEWGSGYSTIYFTRFMKKHGILYNWVSVESDKEWVNYVQEQVKDDPNVSVFYKTELDDYVLIPSSLNEQYTVALVDGKREWRGQCIAEAKKIADVVLLHDAQRKSYLPFAQGTFIAGRLLKIGPNRPFSRFIQLARYNIHERLWKIKQAVFN